jgi:hypothetical protein
MPAGVSPARGPTSSSRPARGRDRLAVASALGLVSAAAARARRAAEAWPDAVVAGRPRRVPIETSAPAARGTRTLARIAPEPSPARAAWTVPPARSVQPSSLDRTRPSARGGRQGVRPARGELGRRREARQAHRAGQGRPGPDGPGGGRAGAVGGQTDRIRRGRGCDACGRPGALETCERNGRGPGGGAGPRPGSGTDSPGSGSSPPGTTGPVIGARADPTGASAGPSGRRIGPIRPTTGARKRAPSSEPAPCSDPRCVLRPPVGERSAPGREVPAVIHRPTPANRGDPMRRPTRDPGDPLRRPTRDPGDPLHRRGGGLGDPGRRPGWWGELAGRGATRRTGEVTAGAPRLTVAATGERAAPEAGRGGGATAWRAASTVLATVEDPDPVARPANGSTSLAVAFKVVPTGSRSRASRRSAASAGRDDRSRRRPAQNANRPRRIRSRRPRAVGATCCTRSKLDLHLRLQPLSGEFSHGECRSLGVSAGPPDSCSPAFKVIWAFCPLPGWSG